ncbi:hypothetical protein QWZ13_19565 [Reinekea marina]|uniref:hypothetical protein n=1 Tax=Reinekea marina TaxID=1310421 RepID=UPI0025B40759|nr:hypothetical protein [Reinekea marina]MDN3647546.1 hypothetical protein [Reinekea marina]MDN3651115.1 hypothetical protein [Reinekea marina]
MFTLSSLMLCFLRLFHNTNTQKSPQFSELFKNTINSFWSYSKAREFIRRAIDKRLATRQKVFPSAAKAPYGTVINIVIFGYSYLKLIIKICRKTGECFAQCATECRQS